MRVNAQYNVAKPESLAVRVAGYQRRKMFEQFVKKMEIGAGESIADVGATSDRTYEHSNYLEAWYPQKQAITAVGIDDASFLEAAYPGMTFLRADGRDLPFADRSFDFVHSSAVLEHVGNAENQTKFLRELRRIARKGVFVTTPNRWFPVEFHTVLPLVHWLPATMFRKLLVALGKGFFALEENLNLVSPGQLHRLASRAGYADHLVSFVSIFGWPTNLILSWRVQR